LRSERSERLETTELKALSTGRKPVVADRAGAAHDLGMAWTYIVRCVDDSYYVGSTVDLDRRLSEHNLGLGAVYTRKRRPVVLVWSAEFERIEEAFAFEKQVQGWGRRKREALIVGEMDLLPVLASRRKRARQFREGS
jgi:putative endonuclease